MLQMDSPKSVGVGADSTLTREVPMLGLELTVAASQSVVSGQKTTFLTAFTFSAPLLSALAVGTAC